jgi:hypothetical protein
MARWSATTVGERLSEILMRYGPESGGAIHCTSRGGGTGRPHVESLIASAHKGSRGLGGIRTPNLLIRDQWSASGRCPGIRIRRSASCQVSGIRLLTEHYRNSPISRKSGIRTAQAANLEALIAETEGPVLLVGHSLAQNPVATTTSEGSVLPIPLMESIS